MTRTRSDEEGSSSQKPPTPTTPVPAIPDSLKAEPEYLCKSLKEFRRRLLKGDPIVRLPDNLSLLQEIEQELALTTELIARKLGDNNHNVNIDGVDLNFSGDMDPLEQITSRESQNAPAPVGNHDTITNDTPPEQANQNVDVGMATSSKAHPPSTTIKNQEEENQPLPNISSLEISSS